MFLGRSNFSCLPQQFSFRNVHNKSIKSDHVAQKMYFFFLLLLEVFSSLLQFTVTFHICVLFLIRPVFIILSTIQEDNEGVWTLVETN